MTHIPQVPDRVPRLLEELSAELTARDRLLLDAWPFSRYVKAIERYAVTAPLSYASSEVAEACGAIRKRIGDDGLEHYHRALLLALMLHAAAVLPGRNMPEDVLHLIEVNFVRIAGHIESTLREPGFYQYPLSPFCKDLAICALRLIPTGSWKVNLSRLPRRIFIASGIRGGLKAIEFAVRDRRGLTPYYWAHVHSQDEQALREFNSRGWVVSFLRVAELLRRNPGVKGLIGAGWLCDPALFSISPHLAHLVTIPVNHGGSLFLLGPCGPDGIRDATHKSNTRRRLYEQGLYRPNDYAVIWPRKELIAWADSVAGVDIETIRAREAPRILGLS